ncbi:MAG: hypothetical protein U5L06_00665 [Rhodovibrio sp.]|nr:hypothetical protein [Rhodovibrio sp.]
MTSGLVTAGRLPTAGRIAPGTSQASFDPYAVVYTDPAADVVYLAEVETRQAQPASGAAVGSGTAGKMPTAGRLRPNASGITGTVTVYFGSETYVAKPTDAAANRVYEGALIQPGRIQRSALGSQLLVGGRADATGEQVYTAIGSATEVLRQSYLDGRSLKIKALDRRFGHPSLDTARTVFSGAIVNQSFDRRELRLEFGPDDARLRRPIQSGRYAGTGGIEGGSDLKGKPYPVPLGRVYGVQPDYLGVVSGNHSYRVAGGTSVPIKDVPALYDQGVALTKVASSPGASEYSIDTSTGVITLGGTPAGTITCDVEGYAPGGSLDATPAGVIQAVLEDFAQLRNTQIDYQSLTDLAADISDDTGVWVPSQERSSRRVLENYGRRMQIVIGFTRLKQMSAQLIKAPGKSIRARFDSTNLLDIERIPGPAVLDPPPWRISVGYRQNYSVTTDVVSGASEAQRRFMAAEWREESASDVEIQDRHRRSTPRFMQTALVDADAGSREAFRRLALYDDLETWRLRAMNVSPQLDIGEDVEIDMPEEGLNNRLAKIVALDLDLRARTGDIEVIL